jgi:poly(hydroxyalkanoate) depolymerase family esterase
MHPLSRVLALALAAGCGVAAAPPSPPDAAARPRVEWHEHASDAGARRYRLVIPPGLDPSRPAPLLVLLHGCAQDPDDLARGTRFDAAAARAGAVLAYPEQTREHHPQRCWTWYEPSSGEPRIVAAIAREVMGRPGVDPARVYVAGISAGAAMALNAVAADPALFAAAAVHSGVPFGAAASVAEGLALMRDGPEDAEALAAASAAVLRRRPGGALPLIVLHGAADAVVDPSNARALAAQWAPAGAVDVVAPSRDTVGGLAVERELRGTSVELWLVDGLGHAWSGGAPEGTFTDTRGPDATGEILRFLLSHRMQR